MTLPTAANPSSESPCQTRSTVVVSTPSVSVRVPGPKIRASEAASLAGGAAGCCAASRRSASPTLTSELVADAEAQHLVLTRAARVAKPLVVTLERRVPSGLVCEAQRGDAAREGGVPRDAGGNVGLGVVALVAHEGAEPLGRRGCPGVEQGVRSLAVPARHAAPHGRGVAGVDRGRVAQADVRYHPAEARRPRVVARVGGDECDGRGERAGPQYAVCIRTAPVPERPADLQPRPRPFEPPGDRRVCEAGLPSLLAPLPHPH